MASPLQKRKLMGDINVVPYIDVMLVLLIIFMVTAPLLTQGVQVELPKAGAEPITDLPDTPPLVLSVDRDGNLFINFGDGQDSPASADEIVRRASILINEHPNIPVLVKGDRAVPYGNVVGAMVLLQRAGAAKVGFVTDPLDTYPIPE
ncbi:protein TolR [Woeseia oceani]|uniref:Tol-Pal system protein TolR n=1 Tax=Woeseia oceani TaxID=1548547 RepID=A0A193LFP5_9GAMM|nr:protein TolR [Woeseia oceani]ANO51288.1 protein TolR [Woeseia oceani]